MAGKKYKATGCARFFLVLIILLPVAYFGAKAISGGAGVPVIDNFIEKIISKVDNDKTAIPNQSTNPRTHDLEKQDKVIRNLQIQIDELKEENVTLKKEIERLKLE